MAKVALPLASVVAVSVPPSVPLPLALATVTVTPLRPPDLIIQDWFGLLVKTGTPNEIVARLNEATNKALAKPRVREAIAKMAAEPAGGTPAEFGQFLGAQLAHWSMVVTESGIKMHQ